MNDLSNLTDAELDRAMTEHATSDVVLDELTALRKLRKAVTKLVIYARLDASNAVHPRDWQQMTMFLEEAEKLEVRHVGDDPHV